jgi:cytochrome c
MFTRKTISWFVLCAAASAAPTLYSQQLGQPINESQLENFDLVAGPDGLGFPLGSGSATQGKAVFEAKCAACHAVTGEGLSGSTRLVGGSMQSEANPLRTVGSFWPHASTLFDFIRRAMPANAPKSLSNTEVYQATAYVLFLNGIITEDTVVDKHSLLEIVMPNADGFIDQSHLQ